MFDPEAVSPLPGKIPLQRTVHQSRDNHGDQGSQARQRHILLSVPDVSLRAEVRRAQVPSEKKRSCPLKKLIHHGGGHREIKRQEVAPEALHVRNTQVYFTDRIGKQQAVTEVDHAVEIVPLPSEQAVQGLAKDGLKPSVIRHFCVRIMGPDFMQAEKEKISV